MRHSQETAGLVLVVEDNRNISEMIGEYLEGRGFEVADPPGMAEKLASYGADARYMVRRLTD